MPQHPSRDAAVLNLQTRRAQVSDAERLARLVSQLGYPTAPDQMRRRLQRILEDADYETLVACDDAGHLAGFVGTRIGPLYEDDGLYGQIMALAVGPDYQRRGVGRTLVQLAESNLVQRGARVLVVSSGNHRVDAHAFYESLGYRFTGRRYRKPATT